MKIEDCHNAYDYFSGKASEIARQLSFAGIALIWIFKADNGGPLALPQDLVWPALFLVGVLALDLLHYVSGSIVWGFYGRYKEWKGVKEGEEFSAPVYINGPALVFFWTKLAAVAYAYYLIIAFVSTQLKLF